MVAITHHWLSFGSRLHSLDWQSTHNYVCLVISWWTLRVLRFRSHSSRCCAVQVQKFTATLTIQQSNMACSNKICQLWKECTTNSSSGPIASVAPSLTSLPAIRHGHLTTSNPFGAWRRKTWEPCKLINLSFEFHFDPFISLIQFFIFFLWDYLTNIYF